MDRLERRDIFSGLAAFAAMAAVGGLTADAQEGNGEQKLEHSQLFPFAALPVHASENGMVSRAVVKGIMATGETVGVHETMLPAGQMPHPPHRHTHSEFLLIREGKLEVVSEGKTGVIEAGGVIFTASGVLHSLKNVGDTPANYFVVEIGIQKVIV